MLKILLIVTFAALAVHILYINGYGVISNKRAVMYVGSIRGKTSCKAMFTSCSGTIKRVMKFKESKIFRFHLISNLSKGSLTVEILDAGKRPLCTLSEKNPIADIKINAKGRYYLVFTFQSATGDYILNWE